MHVSQSMLSGYKSILDISINMLQLAQQADWEKLIELEQLYVNAINELPAITEEQTDKTTLSEQQQIQDCLQQILHNESEISRLLKERMEELKTLIGTSSRQKSVNQAYHKFADDESMLPGDIS
ncbi:MULTISPECIES: flagellar protein FliT [unclassified Brenneria]|uniref:flagellar protein FliT n=1 Tax=unclassified Brenneria TaxID=2634434 RepID=UPI00155580A4|nr:MULTISPECIES: flagellar protein FliT [unclassified Brenneria]MBJ7220430.1 flagellar protein FliT [Brenneria sp. L3-3C-1]MEE3641674.1 flagellar protein FliT [Brenneria sp. L3_3C_1]MEE3649695.1 flagellar protein FliT [Brenneria sp. HEZEL_4_2_4]NPC99653.1 flagellar protein FliT [Brenneria sp. hezel4-2-4]